MRISDWSSDVCSSDLLDLADVAAMIEVEQAADLLVVAADAAGEFNLGDAFLAHGLVERQLGRHQRRQHGPAVAAAPIRGRSEERRVGKRCGNRCRSRWST